MLEDRKAAILAAVIQEYVKTAVPVSSSLLVEKYGFDMSSATMRNELMALEEEGFLVQPHTSAGRIPTDKGYRYFVDYLMQHRPLSEKDQHTVQTELLELKAQYSRLARTTAKLLAALSHNVGVTRMDEENTFESGMKELLHQPEFRDADHMYQIVEALDYLDEHVDELVEGTHDRAVDVYIGRENPIKHIENCSMIVSGFTTPEGEKGLIAVIGPKRMKYDRNVALVEYLTKFLTSGLVIMVMVYSVT